MAIVLKYGSPGAILGAGYAAGVGRRQNEKEDDLLKLWQQGQQQQFQAGQNYLGRQQQAQLQAQAFTQQAEQNRLGRNFQVEQQNLAQGFQAEQAGLQRTFQEGQQKTLLDARSKEREEDRKQQTLHDFDVQALEGVRRGQLELPPAAQKRLDQLDAGLVDAMKLSPAEQDEFYKKYQDEKRSLLRTAQPTKQLPYGERLQQALQSVPEEHRNQPWQLNKDNELVLPTGYKMSDPAAEQMKLTDKYQASNEKYVEQLQKEAQRLSDANVPAKGQAAKPWTDYVDEAKKNLAKIGRTAPQAPGQPVQPVGNPPAAPPVGTTPPRRPASLVQPVGNPPAAPPEEQFDPRAVQQYNQMQDMLGKGQRSWTSGEGTAAPSAGSVQPVASDEFSNKSKTLKTGEGLMGPDGKYYIKR